ncbi:putative glycolipid-binding domain-containing protein [Rhodospirillaceae bacterium KN72]|uniref:Putative glycolipid-binding domain-containing protein n=1 Tax=Pacificispira spongiicola TaxID=2729598 RepID=A0A7Y0HCL5_9PROT|nr:putative glycolipid-binding domain-containing protein [Pacificispira spongiicola]NMM42861.1 putative glycolipid-binding domain-containing protein [Pacificispira spongiicola]
MRQERTVLWNRLDMDGMEACRFRPMGDGWEIQGTASYRENSTVVSLTYSVLCTDDWISRSARIVGWQGDRDIHIDLNRAPNGKWTVNGRHIDGTDGLFDVDLGFTPATNTIAIRRLNLAIGEEAESTAVWLDVTDWSWKPLRQMYRRIAENEYWYVSPEHSYEAVLTIDPFGVVATYPSLWSALP